MVLLQMVSLADELASCITTFRGRKYHVQCLDHIWALVTKVCVFLRGDIVTDSDVLGLSQRVQPQSEEESRPYF